MDGRHSAAAEHIARRILQQQAALRKDPKSANYDSLEPYMAHAMDVTGVARALCCVLVGRFVSRCSVAGQVLVRAVAVGAPRCSKTPASPFVSSSRLRIPSFVMKK